MLYRVYNDENGYEFDISQEDAKYAFENLQLGNYLWTTRQPESMGEIVRKIIRPTAEGGREAVMTILLKK